MCAQTFYACFYIKLLESICFFDNFLNFIYLESEILNMR